MLYNLLLKRIFWAVDIALTLSLAFVAAQLVKGAFPSIGDRAASMDSDSVFVASQPSDELYPASYFDPIANFAGIGKPLKKEPEPTPTPEPAVETLAETTLNLKLHGTVTGLDGMALIQDMTSSSGQKVYRVNQEVISGAILAEIRPRQVVLARSGQKEVLTMKAEQVPASPAGARRMMAAAPGRRPPGPPVPQQAARPQTPAPGQPMVFNRQDILNKAREYAGVLQQVKPQPYRVDGKFAGIDLGQLPDHQIFKEIGVQSGDIITSVNGEEVSSMAKAFELAQKYQNESSLKIGVIRNGRPQTLNYTLH